MRQLLATSLMHSGACFLFGQVSRADQVAALIEPGVAALIEPGSDVWLDLAVRLRINQSGVVEVHTGFRALESG